MVDRAPRWKLATHFYLVLYPQNRVLCRLGNTKFDDDLGWNLDLLLRLRIKARARLPLLLYEFPKSRDHEFAVLFGRFAGDVAERIQKYSRGPGDPRSARLSEAEEGLNREPQ